MNQKTHVLEIEKGMQGEVSGQSTNEWWFLLVARCFIALLFVFSGIEKIFKYGEASSFAASHGIPYASTLMPLAILLEIGCASLLLTSRYCRYAAGVLAIWTFLLNFGFHQFWKVPDDIWQLMVDAFFHSFVMVGGLMYVVVFGAGVRRAA